MCVPKLLLISVTIVFEFVDELMYNIVDVVKTLCVLNIWTIAKCVEQPDVNLVYILGCVMNVVC